MLSTEMKNNSVLQTIHKLYSNSVMLSIRFACPWQLIHGKAIYCGLLSYLLQQCRAMVRGITTISIHPSQLLSLMPQLYNDFLSTKIYFFYHIRTPTSSRIYTCRHLRGFIKCNKHICTYKQVC